MGTAKRYLLAHGPRVAILSAGLSDRLGLGTRKRSEIFFAANLCDVGMIGLVEEAWENPVAVLPPAARAKVLEHPKRSGRTVTQIPHLTALTLLVHHHHEWWDGSGYPDGLVGDAIPIGAQIIRLADTVTALGGVRPHRGALNEEEIASVVSSGSGREFGPTVVEAYLSFASEGLPSYQASLYRDACLDAVADIVPSTVSPLSTYEFLEILASLIDAKDPYTAGHSRRVGNLAAALTQRLDVDGAILEMAWGGGYLHDVGKVSVPLNVLRKNGLLDREERKQIELHAAAGAEILGTIPGLKHLSPACRHHHERWDGGGYPDGLSGDRIPLVAQILSICDAYDAITSDRVYRPARSHREALEDIVFGAGAQFAPALVEEFVRLPRPTFDDLRRSRRTPPTWLSHSTRQEPPPERNVAS